MPATSSTALEALAKSTRVDGRRFEETRHCHLTVGAAPNATGSAYVEQGQTKVIATVLVRPALASDRWQSSVEAVLMVELQFAAFCSRLASTQESEKRAGLYKTILQGALESVVLLDKHEKAYIDVHILVLQDDGAALAAALIAASLALADAPIEMGDLCAGATVHFPGGDAHPLLDCNGEEERAMPEGSAVLHLGVCPSRGALCMLHSAGPLPATPFERMVLLAKDTAEAVGAEMRRCLERTAEPRAAKRLRAEEAQATEANP